jgi:6-pyruvoyl-tetrahydropterin synthase
MVEVGVARAFRARHRLVLPDGTIHEDAHDYRVEVVVRGPRIPASGMLLDLDVLGTAVAACLAELDGADLDRLAQFAGRPTTVETVADHIWDHVRAGIAGIGPVVSLRVTTFEAADAWATIDRPVEQRAGVAAGRREAGSRGVGR